jgi:hypothetical protein
MPYVLQAEPQEENYEAEDGIDPAQLPPAAVAAQGATAVLAASLRALATRRQSKAPCAPCEKKRRLQRMQALRQRG